MRERCFNARFRDELLNGEVFYSIREAQMLIFTQTEAGGGENQQYPVAPIPRDLTPKAAVCSRARTLSVRMVWTRQGAASSKCWRNSQAVFLSAVATS